MASKRGVNPNRTETRAVTGADPNDERGSRRGDRRRAAGRGPRRLAVAFAALVFVASLVPVPGAASGGGRPGGVLPAWVGVTTAFHLVGYAVLAALVTRDVGRARPERVPAAVPICVGVAVATGVGFGVELVQAPVPWRSFAWTDAAVNAVGAAIGAVIAVGRRGGPGSTSDRDGDR
jgi:hypothetical protein